MLVWSSSKALRGRPLRIEADQFGGAAHAVAIDAGGEQVADHPFVPGQRIDLIAGFREQTPRPIDAALVGRVVGERAVDQP